jgi:hypothetical protein
MMLKQDANKPNLRFWEKYFTQPDKVTSILITIIGTIICIVIMNIVVYIGLFDSKIGQLGGVRKWNLLLNLNHPVETIILGDSSCDFGVLPDIVEEKLGGSAINLATGANYAPLYNAWMLDTYVKRLGAPRNVIIVCTVRTYAVNASSDCVNQIALPWGFWENMEPKPSWIHDRNTLFLIAMDKYLPLYSQKSAISGILGEPGTIPRIYGMLFNRRDAGQYIGVFAGWANQGNPLKLAADSQSLLKLIQERPFEISSDNEQSICTIIKLAKQNNFKVYFVNSPIYDHVYNDPSYNIYFEKFSNDIDKYIDNKTTFLIFKRPMTFTDLQMENPNHLIYSAAKIYTSSMTSEILNVQDNNADTNTSQ